MEEFVYDDHNIFNQTNSTDLDNLFYFIRQRFTKVTLFFPSETYKEFKDHIKTSFSQLISQVGSILNFWTGITVLLFVELVDCVLKMLSQWSQRRQQKEERSERSIVTVEVKAAPSKKSKLGETILVIFTPNSFLVVMNLGRRRNEKNDKFAYDGTFSVYSKIQ